MFQRFKELHKTIYDHHGAGGLLHIILDDNNVDDENIQDARMIVVTNNDIKYAKMKDIYYECLDILQSLSETERENYINMAEFVE